MAMGRAGDVMARTYNVFIKLSVPVIRFLNSDELAEAISKFTGEDLVIAGGQLFDSRHPHLSGLSLVVLSERSFKELKRILKYPMDDDDLVKRICEMLAQNCLDALSTDWGLDFSCQAPRPMSRTSVGKVCEVVSAGWDQTLMVAINYQMEDHDYSGDLILLFPNEAIEAMGDRLNELLA